MHEIKIITNSINCKAVVKSRRVGPTQYNRVLMDVTFFGVVFMGGGGGGVFIFVT